MTSSQRTGTASDRVSAALSGEPLLGHVEAVVDHEVGDQSCRLVQRPGCYVFPLTRLGERDAPRVGGSSGPVDHRRRLPVPPVPDMVGELLACSKERINPACCVEPACADPVIEVEHVEGALMGEMQSRWWSEEVH